MSKSFSVLSWNVSGLRAVLRKGFTEFLEKYSPDVLCLQEIKISDNHVEELSIDYPYCTYNCAERKGYSGTAILSKHKPLKVTLDGLGKKHQGEGRVVAYEFDQCYIVNVYTPNSQGGLKRLPYRYEEWDLDFRRYLKKIDNKKPVIACGDYNVAHEEIDLANPKSNRQSPGFTDKERQRFTELLEAGFVDTFRHFNPDKAHQYSWWSYRTNARARNVGWRLDYCLVSGRIIKKVKRAYILKDVLGSDHAPVGIDLSGGF